MSRVKTKITECPPPPPSTRGRTAQAKIVFDSFCYFVIAAYYATSTVEIEFIGCHYVVGIKAMTSLLRVWSQCGV